MITMYVTVDTDGNITRYSNIRGTGIEVIQDDPVIDMSKMPGYEVVYDEVNLRHLVFNEEKYNTYLAREAEKEAFKEATVKLEEMAKEQILPNLSDEDAYDLMILFPSFDIGVEYKAGDRIVFKDEFYKVVTDHISQEDWEPDKTPSVYVKIGNPTEEYPEFIKPTGAHDTYNTGDKVTFEGKKYISTMDNNAYSPTEYPAGWELVE